MNLYLYLFFGVYAVSLFLVFFGAFIKKHRVSSIGVQVNLALIAVQIVYFIFKFFKVY